MRHTTRVFISAALAIGLLIGVGSVAPAQDGDLTGKIANQPATTSPGNVLLLDNTTSITVFTGGASNVSSLVPLFIPLGVYSVSGAWKITTGASVSVITVGKFD